MSFGLCGHMSAFAQSSNDEGWQSLEDFLNQAERVIERQESFDPQALGPGDIISLDIKKVPSLSQNYTIEKNGEIDFPLIGHVNVQGETPEDLAEKLAALYEKDYLVNPAVTISIFAKRLPKVRPTARRTGPASQDIDNQPIALSLPSTDPVRGPIEIEKGIDAETLIENIPETMREPAPQILSAAPLPEFLPERISEPISEPIAIVPLSEPAPLLTDIDAPSPLFLAQTDWLIEGSPEDFIHFLDNGDMAGALSCNSFFARYDAGHRELNFSALTTTSIPCADQSKPQEFIDNLKQAKSYIFSQGELLLLDDQSDIIFALQPK